MTGGRTRRNLAQTRSAIPNRATGFIRSIGERDEILYSTPPTGNHSGNPQIQTIPTFISYYTPDSVYEEFAEQLRTSLRKFDLPSEIQPRKSRGSWVENTCIKPEFIAEVWHSTSDPICWIDADSEVLRSPTFLFDRAADIAFVRRHGWYDMSGTVYFGKSQVSEDIIAEWVRLARAAPKIWDQALLTLAWYRIVRKNNCFTQFLPGTIFRFPRPWIRDVRDSLLYYPFGRKMRPIFDQKQASRQTKTVTENVELGNDDIAENFRQDLVSFKFSNDYSLENAFDRSSI